MKHAFAEILEAARLPATGWGLYQANGAASLQGRMIGWGTVIGLGLQGWAPGAIFFDLDASAGARVLYNAGSTTAASWKTMGTTDAANTWAALQTFTLGLTSNALVTVSAGGVLESSLNSIRIATQTVTDTTTLAADDTLTATLVAGKAYAFEISYNFTTINSSGLKFDLNGGTATMTAIEGNAYFIDADATTSAFMNFGAQEFTTLTPTFGLTASGLKVNVLVKGGLVCNAGGTFIPRFAQNAETGAAESVIAAIGSYMTFKRMN